MSPSYNLTKKLPQIYVYDNLWNQAQTQILNSDIISNNTSSRNTETSQEQNTKKNQQYSSENINNNIILHHQSSQNLKMANRYSTHQSAILNGNNIQIISPQNMSSPANHYPLNINSTSLMQQQQQQLIANTLLQQQAKNQKMLSMANAALNQPQPPQPPQPNPQNPAYLEANQLPNVQVQQANIHRIQPQAYYYQNHHSLNSYNTVPIQNMEYPPDFRIMAYNYAIPQPLAQQIPVQAYYSNSNLNYDYAGANNNGNKLLFNHEILNGIARMLDSSSSVMVGNDNSSTIGVVGAPSDTSSLSGHHFPSQNGTVQLPPPQPHYPPLISPLQQQQLQQFQKYQLQTLQKSQSNQKLSLQANQQLQLLHQQQQQQQMQLQQIYGHTVSSSSNFNYSSLQATNANSMSNQASSQSASSLSSSQVLSKERFDYYLQSAHQKYNSQDYNAALEILLELNRKNPSHLPTLLLLGCTYYSLGRYEQSIKYNEAILQIDSNFSEAYSNLGTTYKAMAQECQNKNKINDGHNHPIKAEDQESSEGYLKLAEECYLKAIKIRPKYWDASINLAILVSTQGRWKDAIKVYQNIETLMENDYPTESRMDKVKMDPTQPHGFINENLEDMDEKLLQDNHVISQLTSNNSRLDNDMLLVMALTKIEENRKIYNENQKLAREQEAKNANNYANVNREPDVNNSYGNIKIESDMNNSYGNIKRESDANNYAPIKREPDGNGNSNSNHHHHHRRHRENNSFTNEKRCNLYFAKGNLYYALNNFDNAKLEYFKGLVIIGIDLTKLFNSAKSGTLPTPTISPQKVFETYHMHMQNPEFSTYNHSSSSILQTLAKIYQDVHLPAVAVAFYYLSLQIYPTANTCNNLGILLSSQRLEESIRWYNLGLKLDSNHVHLYTNLGSALKDRGMVTEGIQCYKQAIHIQGDFFIALANLANVYKDMGKVEDAIELYRRALDVKPDFIEAFCNYVNSLLFVCDWRNRNENLQKISAIVDKQLLESKDQVPKGVPTVLPFHTFTYSSLTAQQVREISHRNADRVLWNVIASDWFPGFPRSILDKYSLRSNNVLSSTITSTASATSDRIGNYPYPYPIPPLPNPYIRIGYLSSDFNNHPLAHLMQSVFGMHDRSRFRVYCYSLSPSDQSQYRQTIEQGADVFVDMNNWSIKDIVERIVRDQIHVLVNLNGYTKGGKNEIFAARPCPIQIATMGFAGTMGAGNIDVEYNPSRDYNEYQDGSPGAKVAESDPDLDWFDRLPDRWMDYLVGDEVSCPPTTVINEPLDRDSKSIDREIRKDPLQNAKMFTESIVYMPQSFFVNDHRQGFREENDAEIESILETDPQRLQLVDITIKNAITEKDVERITGDLLEEDYLTLDERLRWRREQLKRLKMRHELFPNLKEDTVIYANFNQLYKIDPLIFNTWLNILKRMKNSILWLLRFPPSGENNLRQYARNYAGEEVASRVIFTDVAPKHMHIYRGRIADIFLDTVECNAHTTAADILWSGTPIITYPKYQFKMCSRVAASIAYATGSWTERDKKYNYHTVPCKAVGPFSEKAQNKNNENLLGHEMVVGSYQEYEDRAVELGMSMTWSFRNITSWTKEYTDALISNQITRPNGPVNMIQNILNNLHIQAQQNRNPMMANTPNGPTSNPLNPQNTNSYTMLNLLKKSVLRISQNPVGPQLEVYLPQGSLIALRRKLFLTRDQMPLFHTARWVAQLEYAVTEMMKRWEKGYRKLCLREKQAIPQPSTLVDYGYPSLDKPEEQTLSRSIWVPEEVQAVNQMEDQSLR